MKEFRSARPFPWWFVPAYPVGWVATYLIAAKSFLGSVAFFLAWFTGLVVLTVREKKIRAEQRALGPIRAEVVQTPRLDKAGARELVAGVRRELPAGGRMSQ